MTKSRGPDAMSPRARGWANRRSVLTDDSVTREEVREHQVDEVTDHHGVTRQYMEAPQREQIIAMSILKPGERAALLTDMPTEAANEALEVMSVQDRAETLHELAKADLHHHLCVSAFIEEGRRTDHHQLAKGDREELRWS